MSTGVAAGALVGAVAALGAELRKTEERAVERWWNLGVGPVMLRLGRRIQAMSGPAFFDLASIAVFAEGVDDERVRVREAGGLRRASRVSASS